MDLSFVLLIFGLQFMVSSEAEFCGRKIADSINCKMFLECIDGQWKMSFCPQTHHYDDKLSKCVPGDKCRKKRGVSRYWEFGFGVPPSYNIKRPYYEQSSHVLTHSSVSAGYPSSFIDSSDEGGKDRLTTYKKFRYSTKIKNGETKTTMWYYNSNGPNYKFTIFGDLPAHKDDMIDWLEKNHHRYHVTTVPYLGDAEEEEARPSFIPPQVVKPVPYVQRPEYLEHKPEKIPVYQPEYIPEEKPLSKPQPKPTPPPPKPSPRPVNHLTWEDITSTDCGYSGDALKEFVKDKIVGGSETSIEYSPWQVAVVNAHTKALSCGGSIISKYHVLSACHCFVTAKTIVDNNGRRQKQEKSIKKSERLIFVGNDNLNEPLHQYGILELFVHSKYKFSHRRNDIALVLIDGEFEWSPKVYPICLPGKNAMYNTDRTCRVSGWGKKSSEQSNNEENLLAAEVKIVDASNCKRENEKYLNISRGMFCAGDYEKGAVDTCQGDSGGPCTCEENQKSTLFGITSWGIGCGRAKFPGVYVKVSEYLPWIRTRIEISSDSNSRAFIDEDEDIGAPEETSENDKEEDWEADVV